MGQPSGVSPILWDTILHTGAGSGYGPGIPVQVPSSAPVSRTRTIEPGSGRASPTARTRTGR